MYIRVYIYIYILCTCAIFFRSHLCDSDSIPIRWSLGADLRAQVKTSPAAGCGASRGGHHVPTAASAHPSQVPEIKAWG